MYNAVTKSLQVQCRHAHAYKGSFKHYFFHCHIFARLTCHDAQLVVPPAFATLLPVAMFATLAC